MHEGLELRPAAPADAAFIAWGLDEAAGGLFKAMLGRRSRTILAALVAEPGHQFSYQHVTVAAEGGDPRGFCAGWPAGTRSADGALVRAAGWRVVRLAAVAVLGWPVLAAMERHAPGEWYLQALAVTPPARGAGVGRRLIADAVARAAKAGCASLTLDVDAANAGARALYERLGLRVVSTSRPALLLGGVRTHRMRLVLSTGVAPHPSGSAEGRVRQRARQSACPASAARA